MSMLEEALVALVTPTVSSLVILALFPPTHARNNLSAQSGTQSLNIFVW